MSETKYKGVYATEEDLKGLNIPFFSHLPCENCGKSIKRLHYYRNLQRVNGKVVVGNEIPVCNIVCAKEYHNKSGMGGGYMITKDVLSGEKLICKVLP